MRNFYKNRKRGNGNLPSAVFFSFMTSVAETVSPSGAFYHLFSMSVLWLLNKTFSLIQKKLCEQLRPIKVLSNWHTSASNEAATCTGRAGTFIRCWRADLVQHHWLRFGCVLYRSEPGQYFKTMVHKIGVLKPCVYAVSRNGTFSRDVFSPCPIRFLQRSGC